MKRKVKLSMKFVGSSDIFRAACVYENLSSCVTDFVGNVLGSSQYTSIADELAKYIVGVVGSWDDYVDTEGFIGEEEPLSSEPVIESTLSDGTVVRVIESDGVYMPLYGGFLDTGECLAISEITTAYTLIEKGDVPLEKITVVGLFVEYDRSLRPVKAFLYYPQIKSTVRVCNRLVRIKVPSKIGFIVNTYPDIDTLRTVYEAVASARESIGVSWTDVGAEILKRIKEYIYHDDERVYSVIASYATMTYFYDVFAAVPYLWFYGPPGSGKTRANITTTYLSRHGLVVEDITPASIYRLTDAAGPTLGVDESKLDEQSKRIIAAGYKRGMVVPRAEPTRDGIVLTLFEAMAPRVFSFIDPPEEGYQRQRSILINMMKAKPLKGEDPTPMEFKEIREKLYMLRLFDLGSIVRAKKEAEEILHSKDVWGREKEIWWPLLTASILIGVKDQVLSFMLEDVAKKREGTYAEEHMVLAAIEKTFTVVTNIENRKTAEAIFRASTLHSIIVEAELEQQDCIDIEKDDENVEKTVTKIECRKIEEDLKRKWSVQKIGRILQRLGFDKYKNKIGKGQHARLEYRVDSKAFLNIAKRYGYSVAREDLKSVESAESAESAGDIQEKTVMESPHAENFSGVPQKTLPTLPTLPTAYNAPHQPHVNRSAESDGAINSADLGQPDSADHRSCVVLEEFLKKYTPRDLDAFMKEGRVGIKEVGDSVLVCYRSS